jgi:hypothetical protein
VLVFLLKLPLCDRSTDAANQLAAPGLVISSTNDRQDYFLLSTDVAPRQINLEFP